MIPLSDSGAVDYRAAQVALFILRATLTRAAALDQKKVVLLPDKRPVGLEQAARALARLQKPVLCLSRTGNHMLEVDCQIITDSVVASTLADRERSFVSAFNAQFNSREVRSGGDTLILMRDESDHSLVVPVSAVEAFLRNFDVTFGSSFIASESKDRLQGVVAVWVVGPPMRFRSHGPGGTIVGGPK
jgi:hypothetical protein